MKCCYCGKLTTDPAQGFRWRLVAGDGQYSCWDGMCEPLKVSKPAEDWGSFMKVYAPAEGGYDPGKGDDRTVREVFAVPSLPLPVVHSDFYFTARRPGIKWPDEADAPPSDWPYTPLEERHLTDAQWEEHQRTKKAILEALPDAPTVVSAAAEGEANP